MKNKGLVLVLAIAILIVAVVLLIVERKGIEFNRQTIDESLFHANKSNATSVVYCNSDSECVPASCCHPKACVVKSGAPSCNRIFCTQECSANSMDCGQGSCACIENKCQVVWK